jgi:predicted RNA-binding protein with EMAP domain
MQKEEAKMIKEVEEAVKRLMKVNQVIEEQMKALKNLVEVSQAIEEHMKKLRSSYDHIERIKQLYDPIERMKQLYDPIEQVRRAHAFELQQAGRVYEFVIEQLRQLYALSETLKNWYPPLLGESQVSRVSKMITQLEEMRALVEDQIKQLSGLNVEEKNG